MVKISGDKMSGIVAVEAMLTDELLSLTEYYDAILSRSGMIRNECEFRNQKLSMILDFIRTTCIPEKHKTKLSSAIIKSWRLQVPEITLKQREEELKEIFRSITSIRCSVKSTKKCINPMNGTQISFRVLSDLPITHLDFFFEDVPRIFELLKQNMDHCIHSRQGYVP
jgi:hypothetical protein